jgi:hypothetical protein
LNVYTHARASEQKLSTRKLESNKDTAQRESQLGH